MTSDLMMSSFDCALVLGVVILSAGIRVHCVSNLSYHAELVNYSTALQKCKSKNMTTLVVETEDTLVAVEKYLRGISYTAFVRKPIWIGLKLPILSDKKRDYVWSNESPLTWNRWERGEPDNLSTDKCVVLYLTGWRSRTCADKYSFVCQSLHATATGVETPAVNRSTSLHFIQVKNMIPSGPVIQQYQAASSVQCADFCLREEGCDVIVWSKTYICRLFSNLTLFKTGNTTTSLIYKRK